MNEYDQLTEMEQSTGAIPSAFPGSNELVMEQNTIGGIDLPTELPMQVPKLGGLIEVVGTDTLKREDEIRERAAAIQTTPVIQGVAAYIRKCWQEAKSAKEQKVQPRMLQSLRQRRGEYEPEVLAQLQTQNSSLVYMQITGNKCRSAAAWLRDALGNLPWECEPTPVATLEPELEQTITNVQAPEVLMQAMQMGYMPQPVEVVNLMAALKDEGMANKQDMARKLAERMTRKMRDQMIEGGFEQALDAFIDDLVTFPSAILKGPVVRSRPALRYVKGVAGWDVVVDEQFKLEWERVSPFDIYPAPDASDIDDGYLIERHRLSRGDLQALRQVEGYSPDAINAALAEYSSGFIDEMAIDAARQEAEGKAVTMTENPSNLIEALQFWGPVQGRMLIEWGMNPAEIGEDFDSLTDYEIEAWLVGNYVIKLQLNPDPLNRKPYYKTSLEQIPGSFWGNSIPDLCRDVQRICNSAARALVNNIGIASGPQVVVDIDRLPKGTEISEMYPWKIWLVDSGKMPSPQAPMTFFQPTSNAGELMNIYNTFAVLADEHTGIPRYMTGSGMSGGAGRTASGMSMLMNNAGKTIKSVVANVDRVLKPAIERLYFYNMMYGKDPDLKGDVNIVVKGALNISQQELQQQRITEMLTMVFSNPAVMNIVGPKGTLELLRRAFEKLGIDLNKILPTPEMMRVQEYVQQMQMQQMMMAQAAMAQQGQPPNGVSQQPKPDQRQLMDGSPQVNAVS